VDGGIKRGIDVFKCLALGATCVFLGRPVLFSVSVGGKEGLNKVMNILEKELIQTM
jgi:isopentenyl diphosphate isomerase/L-lactate dehydrogenase-like FMN-dependent dehydrogenase